MSDARLVSGIEMSTLDWWQYDVPNALRWFLVVGAGFVAIVASVDKSYRAAAHLWKTIRESIHPLRLKKPKPDLPHPDEHSHLVVKHPSPRKWIRNIMLTVFLAALTMQAVGHFQLHTGPLNEQYTKQAWDAYKKGDFDHALKITDQCIAEFQGSADRFEEQLQKTGTSLPSGTVSVDDKKRIFANGLLNDVATCMYIKGRSAESLGRYDIARATYEVASRYMYARAWDESGFFWSPAEAAADRLSTLKAEHP